MDKDGCVVIRHISADYLLVHGMPRLELYAYCESQGLIDEEGNVTLDIVWMLPSINESKNQIAESVMREFGIDVIRDVY